jgi:hypothetical protein
VVHRVRRNVLEATSRAERWVLWRACAIAGSAALALALVVPRGGDAAAHLYRTLLVEHGALLWDNLWFAGQYPLVSYSLFYYLPAAVFGNPALAAAAVVASGLLFASLVLRTFGAEARWPAYAFAAVAGGQFFTGDYPYTVGFAALLATLWALQRGRTWLAVACAALTIGCSPLAFLLLGLTLLALWIGSSQPRSRILIVGESLGVLVAVELGALLLFPTPGLYYPFGLWRLVLGLPVGVVGIALASRSRAARPLFWLFLVWTVATVLAYVVPSPVGHNLLRPGAVVFPLMLLAAVLCRFRPRWLACSALAIALAANLGPYVATVISRADPAGRASFWTPLLRYVGTHSARDYRLEVVPTINHWEAYYVPRAGFAIARGWYQQLDNGVNPRLNRRGLTAAGYRAWLRSVGVRYVLLAHDTPAANAVAEARLLRNGKSGLRRVFVTSHGSVYELPRATPILTGPGRSALTSLSFSGIGGWASKPGSYLLRVHYTPLWRVRAGALCPLRGAGGMTRLQIRRAGAFELRAAETADTVLEMVVDDDAHRAASCGGVG